MSVTGRSPEVTAGTVLAMPRTGIVPRSALVPRAGRALAVVLASLALLLCGTVEVLPRSAAAAAAPAVAAAAPGGTTAAARAPRSSSLEAPASSLAVRAAGLAGVPAPSGPGGGLPPADGPLVAPHVVADPQSRPPTSPRTASPAGTPGSRAPPGRAGT
jgi:hypothetical protein